MQWRTRLRTFGNDVIKAVDSIPKGKTSLLPCQAPDPLCTFSTLNPLSCILFPIDTHTNRASNRYQVTYTMFAGASRLTILQKTQSWLPASPFPTDFTAVLLVAFVIEDEDGDGVDMSNGQKVQSAIFREWVWLQRLWVPWVTIYDRESRFSNSHQNTHQLNLSEMSTFRLILFGIRRLLPLCSFQPHPHSTASLLRPCFSLRPIFLLHPISSQFHTSSARRLTPNIDIDPNIDPIVRRLLEHPKLLQNIQDYVELLSKKGIDVSGKTMPSTFMLMRFMRDPEVQKLLLRTSLWFLAF